jgi:hypothetical protein
LCPRQPLHPSGLDDHLHPSPAEDTLLTPKCTYGYVACQVNIASADRSTSGNLGR